VVMSWTGHEKSSKAMPHNVVVKRWEWWKIRQIHSICRLFINLSCKLELGVVFYFIQLQKHSHWKGNGSRHLMFHEHNREEQKKGEEILTQLGKSWQWLALHSWQQKKWKSYHIWGLFKGLAEGLGCRKKNEGVRFLSLFGVWVTT
jgi:hypothetical protein